MVMVVLRGVHTGFFVRSPFFGTQLKINGRGGASFALHGPYKRRGEPHFRDLLNLQKPRIHNQQ